MLRVLAYHGVESTGRFALQLDDILSQYSPVSGAEVVAAAGGEARLPSNAVWITFDDGLATVVDNALPILAERGLPATMFVCPGLVEGNRRPWWTIVEEALAHGWRYAGAQPEATVRSLKLATDADRRSATESANVHLATASHEQLGTTVVDRTGVEAWLAAGMQLGNHTWDLPCLDRCAPAEQASQIARADEWLSTLNAFASGRVFAYPNGDWTESAERTLTGLGYKVALLFDHRSSRTNDWNPLRTSRFRIDALASTSRARAIVSGAHSLIYRPTSPITSSNPAAA